MPLLYLTATIISTYILLYFLFPTNDNFTACVIFVSVFALSVLGLVGYVIRYGEE